MFSLCNRIFNLWISLPDNIITAHSLNSFKTNLINTDTSRNLIGTGARSTSQNIIVEFSKFFSILLLFSKDAGLETSWLCPH